MKFENAAMSRTLSSGVRIRYFEQQRVRYVQTS